MRFESGTQSISWFQKEYKEGTITLRPPYQRKPVWAARQKCYLIESILLGMPVPEIFIHETTQPNGETVHAIVDGQQRIRTVLQFLGLETLGPEGLPEPEESEFTGFALDKFEPRAETPNWLGKKFTDLTKEERIKLFEYKFHVLYLYDATEEDLRSMFTRLNRYLTALKPQELRHATYVGPFAKLSEALAEDEYWLQSGLMTRALIRRLGDVEFISQLLIGVLHGPQGGSATVIDEYYRTYEDYDLDEGFPDERRARKVFEQTLKFLQTLFPKLQENDLRWGNRTDFYSLFVAIAEIFREHSSIPSSAVTRLRAELIKFGKDIDKRLADEHAAVSTEAVAYVRAVEKGANDKARRADRHRLLVELLEDALGIPTATAVELPKTGKPKGKIGAKKK